MIMMITASKRINVVKWQPIACLEDTGYACITTRTTRTIKSCSQAAVSPLPRRDDGSPSRSPSQTIVKFAFVLIDDLLTFSLTLIIPLPHHLKIWGDDHCNQAAANSSRRTGDRRLQ